jgi:hypothetical protein
MRHLSEESGRLALGLVCGLAAISAGVLVCTPSEEKPTFSLPSENVATLAAVYKVAPGLIEAGRSSELMEELAMYFTQFPPVCSSETGSPEFPLNSSTVRSSLWSEDFLDISFKCGEQSWHLTGIVGNTATFNTLKGPFYVTHWSESVNFASKETVSTHL